MYICVCECLLTAPDCCETHRENSLFPFQSAAQATSITADRERGGGGGGVMERKGGVTGEGMILILMGIFVFKA